MTSVDIARADVRVQGLSSFGCYVRSVRQRAGITSYAMAELVGVSAPYYARVELGKKAPLDPERWEPLLAVGAEVNTLRMLAAHFQRSHIRGRRRAGVSAGLPGSRSWEDVPWEDDDYAWYVVAHHPEGLSTEQVAGLIGLSPERVAQIESEALAKLRDEDEAHEAYELLCERAREERAMREAGEFFLRDLGNFDSHDSMDL